MYIDKKYLILGIRGAKGATLPRLCFAQLAFALCVKCYFVVKCIKLWTHTQLHGHTDTHNYIYKQMVNKNAKIKRIYYRMGWVTVQLLWGQTIPQFTYSSVASEFWVGHILQDYVLVLFTNDTGLQSQCRTQRSNFSIFYSYLKTAPCIRDFPFP